MKYIFLFAVLANVAFAQDYNNLTTEKGLYGFKDKEAQINIPHVYEAIHPVADADKRFVVKKDGYWGIVDGQNQIILPLEYEISDPAQQLLLDGYPSYYNSVWPLAIRNKSGKWSFISLEGKVLLPFEYEYTFSNFSYSNEETDNVTLAQKDGKIYVFDLDMKLSKTLNYAYLGGMYYHYDTKAYYAVLSKDGLKYVFFNLKKGKEETLKFEEIEPESPVVVHNPKGYVLIDFQGKIISKYYSYIYNYAHDCYRFPDQHAPKYLYICQNEAGKKGLLDQYGAERLSLQYDSIEVAQSDHRVPIHAAKQNGKWFAIKHLAFTKLSQIGYDFIDTYHHDPDFYFLLVFEKNHCGFINRETGQELLAPSKSKYNYLRPALPSPSNPEGLFPVEKNEKYGFVNAKYELVIPLKYAYAGEFKDGKARVETTKGDMYDIDIKGNKIE